MNSYYQPRKTEFTFEESTFNKEICYLKGCSKSSHKFLIVSDRIELSEMTQIKPNQVNQYLGQELEFLYYDAVQHFDVNQFVAIVGCLVGGGTLVLHLPEYYKQVVHSFSKYPDSFDDFKIPEHKNQSQLLLRFVKMITEEQTANTLVRASDKNSSYNQQKHQNSFFLEQDALIKKIERCALGHAKRPLAITADRGRGKSTALAKASANLCFNHKKNIIITAPRKANLIIFFQQFNQSLIELIKIKTELSSKLFSEQVKDATERIKFVAIDKFNQEQTSEKFLIVDEAGSFPIQVLTKVIKKFNRLIFSSTVCGYEGNGRGFEIKFFPLLEKLFPQYREEKLTTPCRWQTNDLIENCCNKAFLLGKSTKIFNIKNENSKKSSNIYFEFVDKEHLRKNEALLTDIFSLLIEAHYQTRPSDLERMLSDKNLQVYIGQDDEKTLVSACLIVKEGRIAKNDCEDISKGKRRFKGQLLPQSLISTQGLISAGELYYWRIMRIAVIPSQQKQFIGSNMIEYIVKQAKSKSVDLVGASFALSTSLFNFWSFLNFSCFRIALKIDSSTGLIPADFLLPISDKGKSCFKNANNRFNQSFIYSSSASYKQLDSELLFNILSHQVAIQLKFMESTQISLIKEDIENYINQARNFEMVEWQVSKLFLHFLSHSERTKTNDCNLSVVFAKVFQKHTWREISNNFGLSGKIEATNLLRSNVESIYNLTF